MSSLSPYEIELVQQSFAKVATIAETAARLFYGRLFEIAPAVRPLFKEDLSEQGKKLMRTLALAVGGLSQMEKLLPALHHLGRRHLQYGCVDEHYDVVGEALLWTLEQGLGTDFTPELRDAWVKTYTEVAAVMKEAAAEAEAEGEVAVNQTQEATELSPAHREEQEAYESQTFQDWLQSAAFGF